MKVILQKNVQKLGKAGDVVEAKPGYFRNFLGPRGLATMATEGAMAKREHELEGIRAKAEKLHQEALDTASRITELGAIKVSARAGEAGRLYGKVTTKDIGEELGKALSCDIDKRAIRLLEDITAVGTYKAYIKIAADVQAEFNVEVTAAE